MDKVKLTGLSGLFAAGVGAICCVGPAVLAGLGFGVGAISFARDFGFLHLPMMMLAIVLLGAAFYMRYHKAGTQKESSATCDVVPEKRQSKSVFLWVATAFTLFLFIYPYLR